MLNQLVLVGRLVKTPELKKSGETTLTSFTLAFDTRGKEESSFIECISFNRVADALVNYAKKGDLIAIVGSIRQRRFTSKEGQNRSVIEVLVDSVEFLSPKKEEPKDPNPAETMDDPVINEKPPLADGWEYDEHGVARKIKTTAKK